MRTLTVKLYKLEELKESTRDVALCRNRNINIQEEWEHDLEKEFRDKLESIGFSVNLIYRTGFEKIRNGSIKNGAMFTGEVEDFSMFFNKNTRIGKLIKARKIILNCPLTHQGNHFFGPDSARFLFTHSQLKREHKNIRQQVNDIEDNIVSIYREECEKFFYKVQQRYLHLTGNEAVTQTINDRGMEFYESGEEYIDMEQFSTEG